MIANLLSDSCDTLSREAIHDLYSTLGRELWAIFYAKCSDHAVADDVLNEAFTRLLAHGGGPIKNPRAWLIHVGKNLVFDHLRRAKRCQTRASCLAFEACQTAPDEDLLLRELRDRVRDSLSDLCVDYRLVLVLRYGLGYSTKRIAEVMENSVAAADMQLSRARRRLAEALNDRGINHASDLSTGNSESHL